jgi:hypothetical protein
MPRKKSITPSPSITEESQDKEFFIPVNYARSHIQPLWATMPKNSTTRLYTNEQINKFLLNPFINYK